MANKGTISVTVGLTRNLGNYQSLRIDAGLTVDSEDVMSDEDWAAAWKRVESEVEARLSELDGELSGGSSK
jgi:hypothetical protein